MKWIGIREEKDEFNMPVFHKIIITEEISKTRSYNGDPIENKIYNVSTYEGMPTINAEGKDGTKAWANTLGSAKRLALQDTGLKSKDFVWESDK